MEHIHKSVTDGQRTWSIIYKNGTYHFRGPVQKCSDPNWINCKKLVFDWEGVADLYSQYQYVKFGRQLTAYYSEDCHCWHLRTSRCHDGMWIGRVR